MKRRFTLLIIALQLCNYVFSQQASVRKTVSKDSVFIDNLPSLPFLPDPLIIDEGTKNTPINNREQWQNKRNWIKEQYQLWISGSVPPAPDSIHVKILSEKEENTVILRMVEISFGPNNKAKLTIELMIPPGAHPLPVFMTQWNHRGWAQIAVRRGYIGCLYAGADLKDDTENYSYVYPKYSFQTLMKRAWAASRVVDYLYTLSAVDTTRIAITGHSRNGKQSLMAAAFDERIKAVVSSSGGTGGENVFRYTENCFDVESIKDITTNFPQWFLPRLQLFSGKEEKLPIDQNSLMALIAPRGLMLSSAVTESQGNPWGIEQVFNSLKKVYQFEGAENKLGISFRNGRHAVAARDIENYIDFFDYVFGRSKTSPENKIYYDYSFEKWKQISKQTIDPLTFLKRDDKMKVKDISEFQEQTKQQIKWLLGDEPPGVSNPTKVTWENSKSDDDFLAEVIKQPNIQPQIQKIRIAPYDAAGEYLWADVYFPQKIKLTKDSLKQKIPLVIFLHEYAYATGYRRRSEPIINSLTKNGFAVLAFDLPGFGTRIEEAKNFYSRYPQWSLMGKMVADTRSIINDIYTRMDFIDKNNVFLMGYSLGGTVALFTAALDTRIKGTAVVSAFNRFRSSDPSIEGIKHYSHLHGLIPKFGFFINNENRIPVDFDEILACVSPRYLHVTAPTRDRHHPVTEVRKMVSNASIMYNKMQVPSHLTLIQPDTYNQYTPAMQLEIVNWFKNIIHNSSN